MRKFRILFLSFLSFILFVQYADASTVYVKDSLEITLRTGPSVENKIIGILRTGDAVEILETKDNWSRVRKVGGNKDLEGWVLGRYLMDRVPWELQASALKKENINLKTNLAELKESLNVTKDKEKSLSTEYQKINNELQNIKRDYEELKESSKDFLALKNSHESAVTSLEAVKKKNKVLEEENQNLHSNQRLKWFGTGAVVLLLGLVMGIVMGKKEKKRKSLYY
jgi:SH3 domain protein